MNNKQILAAAIAGCLSLPLYGQSIEEVLVTAQRRSESVQDIPVAVSAFTSETMERMAITETMDIARMVPNFLAQNNTGLGTANVYSLRGLNNTESIATFDPPVGTYIDDFFIQRQNGNNYALFDIDRVEVLRGPQGTLFGRNTTGGAVRMILRDPSDEMGGNFGLGFGAFGKLTARGSVDLPVSEDFRLKLSAYYVEDDGFVDNLTTGEEDLNFEDNKGLRAHWIWDINDDLSWNASLTYIDNEHANMFNFENGGDRFTRTGLTEAGSPVRDLVIGNKGNLPLGNSTESLHFTSNLSFPTRFGDVEVLTSYLDLEQDFLLDFFEGPFQSGGFTIANEGTHEQFTQEFKISGTTGGGDIDYVAGLFYFDEDNETDFAQIFNLGAIGLFLPGGFPLIQYDRILDNTTESWAIYGQWDWRFADSWTLTAGARFTEEDKDFGLRDNGNPGAGAVITNADLLAAGVPLEQNESQFTPRIAIENQVNDDFMWYGSITTGFKSGGWNARGTLAESLQSFSAEEVTNFEVGMRSEWMDNSLRVNLTAFRADIEDFQLPSAFVNSTGAIEFITRNFADLDTQGLEAEFLWLPTENLTLFANAGLLDSEYSNLDPSILAQQVNCRNNGEQCAQGIVNAVGDIADPVRAPEHQLTIGGWYDFPIGSSMVLTPSVSVTDYGEHSVGTSGEAVAQVDGYTLLNASVTLRNDPGNWQVSLECDNCTDRLQVVSVLAGFPYLNDPKTWQLNFRKSF
ncbi:MAG: TonB-dependent receptor [Lysobacterales bacterium]